MTTPTPQPAPQRITAENPPQWAVEAAKHIVDQWDIAYPDINAPEIAAIIAKHAPQPTAWHPAAIAPENLDVVLCDYPGVYSLRLGYLRSRRFYPFGEQGSVPFKNWMPIPAIPSPDQPTAPECGPSDTGNGLPESCKVIGTTDGGPGRLTGIVTPSHESCTGAAAAEQDGERLAGAFLALLAFVGFHREKLPDYPESMPDLKEAQNIAAHHAAKEKGI